LVALEQLSGAGPRHRFVFPWRLADNVRVAQAITCAPLPRQTGATATPSGHQRGPSSVDPQDRYLLARHHLDERRAQAQRARLLRSAPERNREPSPRLLPVERSSIVSPAGPGPSGLRPFLNAFRLSRAW